METGESLSAPARVQRLQQALHAKAKEAPGIRFYSLCDKVWRADVLAFAWQAVRRNGGTAGVDGETVADIEAHGVEQWLGELARDLKEGTYRPRAVRQVRRSSGGSSGRWAFHAFGTGWRRRRRWQSYRRSSKPTWNRSNTDDAVKRVHRLLNTGHREVVDADLSDYFGQIPHAELLKSVARRVSDGRMLGWVKAWLEMAVEQDDGRGGKRRTNRARRERKGTPQGSPVSPLLSNIYMRRFVLGWKALGYARRFEAGVVSYADDLVVLGKAPSALMLAAVESLMERLRLPINAQKTRCLAVPEEPLEFLGYRIGRNYRRDTGRAYIGTRPSPASVQSICRRISALTAAHYGLLDPELVVGRLNRLMTGWANYFNLQVSPASLRWTSTPLDGCAGG